MKPVLPAQLSFPPFDTPTASTLPVGKKRPNPSLPTAQSHDRVLRRRDVQHETGLSRTALYRLIAANDFPKQVRLSTNTVGWLSSEVNAWIASRVAATRKVVARTSTAKSRS